MSRVMGGPPREEIGYLCTVQVVLDGYIGRHRESAAEWSSALDIWSTGLPSDDVLLTEPVVMLLRPAQPATPAAKASARPATSSLRGLETLRAAGVMVGLRGLRCRGVAPRLPVPRNIPLTLTLG